MSYSIQGLGESASCDQLTAAAKESSRVALTMVRAHRAKGSPEKTRQLAQLLRDWSTGTGESFDDMTRRWQAKAAADDASARGAEAAAKESSRVALTMVTASRKRGSPEKTRQISQLLRDWGQPGEAYDAMMRRRQQKAAQDATAATAARAIAAESSRVSLTMVRARDLKWSPEKDRQIAQLRRDWGQGTGESYDNMMSRWQAKAAADDAAAKACAPEGAAGSGAPSGPGTGAPGGAADPSAPGGGDGGGSESESGKILGMPIWALGVGAGVLVLGMGGVLFLRARKKKSAALAAQK